MWRHIDVWWRLATITLMKLGRRWWWLLILLLRWIRIPLILVPMELVSLIWLLRERILVLSYYILLVAESRMGPSPIEVIETTIPLGRSIHGVYLYRVLFLVD